ncbi:MAG: hypothetical protein UV46_C0055G0012 [Candidatus Gottesmanbacteria bacterium GW2011_GWC2_42_8]|nr:MAG: hypothetical protein UV46_C0055G0012 [Candidatus Gottesmanbacteria bacterium GW2011_GWC2_42_8]
MSDTQEVCPKCGSPLSEVTTTPSGRKLQRCSKGAWNPETKKNDGCPFVKWLPIEPVTLDEKQENEKMLQRRLGQGNQAGYRL